MKKVLGWIVALIVIGGLIGACSDDNVEEKEQKPKTEKKSEKKEEKTDVDAVHVGLLTMIEIPSDWDVKVKETDVLEGKFRTVEEIKELDLENWTASALSVLQ